MSDLPVPEPNLTDNPRVPDDDEPRTITDGVNTPNLGVNTARVRDPEETTDVFVRTYEQIARGWGRHVPDFDRDTLTIVFRQLMDEGLI